MNQDVQEPTDEVPVELASKKKAGAPSCVDSASIVSNVISPISLF